MTTDRDMTAERIRRPGRRRKPSYIPPQHGAWAFLALPLALGATMVSWTPLLAPLAIMWVAAYPLSYAAFGLVRAKRAERFRAPFAVWGAVVAPLAVLLLIWRPWLVWVGLGYVVLLIVNLVYARRNDERSLVNDAVFVVECAGMVAVTWAVGAGAQSWTPPALDSVPAQVWILSIICALVLAGSTLHVKSLIRERRDPRYSQASRVFALACVLASLALAGWWGLPGGLWLVVPFLALAVRAFAVPGRSLRPGAIGVIELMCFVLVVAAAILAGL